jgi:microcystin-dependent protein
MPVYRWSDTAAPNGNSDPNINFLENQAPSSLNDSARALMAAVAQYRDDNAGSLVTTGTSTAYILATNSVFDTAAHLNGQMVMFVPHVTNGAGPVTMTLDSIANIPLRSAPNTELPSGVLIAGTPYGITFNQTDNALYLHGFYGNLGIPLLGGMDFWDTITPASNFIFPMGQAISRTVFANAFARWGTTFGAGDGSTTFNVPDKTGRVSAMLEAAPTRLPVSVFGGTSTNLGAVGGEASETLTLVTANLPPYTPAGTIAITQNANMKNTGALTADAPPTNVPSSTAATITAEFTGTPQGGTSTPIVVPTIQPTIVCNYIIRII